MGKCINSSWFFFFFFLKTDFPALQAFECLSQMSQSRQSFGHKKMQRNVYKTSRKRCMLWIWGKRTKINSGKREREIGYECVQLCTNMGMSERKSVLLQVCRNIFVLHRGLGSSGLTQRGFWLLFFLFLTI